MYMVHEAHSNTNVLLFVVYSLFKQTCPVIEILFMPLKSMHFRVPGIWDLKQHLLHNNLSIMIKM